MKEIVLLLGSNNSYQNLNPLYLGYHIFHNFILLEYDISHEILDFITINNVSPVPGWQPDSQAMKLFCLHYKKKLDISLNHNISRLYKLSILPSKFDSSKEHWPAVTVLPIFPYAIW